MPGSSKIFKKNKQSSTYLYNNQPEQQTNHFQRKADVIQVHFSELNFTRRTSRRMRSHESYTFCASHRYMQTPLNRNYGLSKFSNTCFYLAKHCHGNAGGNTLSVPEMIVGEISNNVQLKAEVLGQEHSSHQPSVRDDSGSELLFA